MQCALAAYCTFWQMLYRLCLWYSMPTENAHTVHSLHITYWKNSMPVMVVCHSITHTHIATISSPLCSLLPPVGGALHYTWCSKTHMKLFGMWYMKFKMYIRYVGQNLGKNKPFLGSNPHPTLTLLKIKIFKGSWVTILFFNN